VTVVDIGNGKRMAALITTLQMLPVLGDESGTQATAAGKRRLALTQWHSPGNGRSLPGHDALLLASTPIAVMICTDLRAAGCRVPAYTM